MCGFTEAMMASKIILGGLNSFHQGHATAGKYDAQAAYLGQKAAVEQERIRWEARRQAARKRVSFATSGVRISGSPSDVLADIATESGYQARLVGWDAAHRARQLESDAASSRRAGANLLGQSGFKVAAAYGEPLWDKLKGP